MSEAMARAEAEALALSALGWMAAQPAIMARFLAETGAAPGDLRAAAADPGFLAAVLDHLLADEASLLACAAALGFRPDRPARARAALPGGNLPHWT